MSTASRPDGPDYFATHPRLHPDVGTDIDTVLNYIISILNSLDDANFDGSPQLQGSKIDFGGAGYVAKAGDSMTALLQLLFEGVWLECRGAGNAKVRFYNNDASALWGITYNTEYSSSWLGRDVTGICTRIEVQSDGVHFYHAVSAAAGIAPTWTEIFHVGITGVLQIADCIQSSNLQNNTVTGWHMAYFTAGDTLLFSNDTERSQFVGSSVWEKCKETTITRPATLRVKYDAYGGTTGAHARIYVNGVARGVDETLTTGYVTYGPEDIVISQADIDAGGLLQVWVTSTSGGESVYVKNFRLYYQPFVEAVETSGF